MLLVCRWTNARNRCNGAKRNDEWRHKRSYLGILYSAHSRSNFFTHKLANDFEAYYVTYHLSPDIVADHFEA